MMMMEILSDPDVEVRRIYVNRPQALVEYIDAAELRCIWSRGTGKSDGIIAPRARRCVEAMPESMGCFVAMSFTQMLTRTLPAMMRGLARRGWKHEVDYTVREKGPKKWPKPLFEPLSWANAIHFRNGAAAMLASQRNPGSANGPDIDWVLGDEAKFLKEDQFNEELLPAMRGNRDKWEHLSLHHSTCLATDMPTSPTGRWLLDFETLYQGEVNQQAIRLIVDTQKRIAKLRAALMAGGLSKESQRVYMSRIRSMEAELNIWRKGTFHFSTADAFDNIHVLGKEYIARMKQLLPDPIFRTSVLNMRLDRVEGGFYPDLDDEHHTYAASESHKVSSADGRQLMEREWSDCEKDGDLIEGVRLEIAPDFGDSFNCLAIGQLFDGYLNIINQVYVKKPGKIAHLARAFSNYYSTHKPRHVRFHCDHTMKGEDAARDYSFINEMERELKKLKWTVERNYIGQTWNHHDRYILWGRAFAKDDTLPLVQFNRVNCEPTLLSMRLAKARTTRKGFEKDKRPEQRDDVDQAEATHLTDAADLLLVGVVKAMASPASGGVSMIFG